MRFILVFLLLYPAFAQANTVCNAGVCREVVTGPIPDSPVVPPKPTARVQVLDVKFWVVTGANIGISIARTRALVKCRADHGIGPCTSGGYGEFTARETAAQVLTAGSIFLSWKVKSIEDRNNDKPKFWWLFQTVPIGLNSGVIIQNALKHYNPKEKD